jgi:hypothetical protein
MRGLGVVVVVALQPAALLSPLRQQPYWKSAEAYSLDVCFLQFSGQLPPLSWGLAMPMYGLCFPELPHF